MVEKEYLVHIAEKFNQLCIPYMVTGSMAVSFYGYPRATHDIDVVLAVQRDDIEHAIEHKQMFNLIHLETLYKIDCWILDECNEYRAKAFQRRLELKIQGMPVWIISAEDLIVSKLLCYKETQTDIHLQDIRCVLKIQKEKLDIKYINLVRSSFCN